MPDIPVHNAETGWKGTITFAPGPEPIAYRPNALVVGGERGRDQAVSMFESSLNAEPVPVFPDAEEDDVETGRLYLFDVNVDPLVAVAELRIEGVLAQPNHVMFAHSCDCCGPHPAHRWAGGLTGAPMFANPMFANPMFANPMFANPMFANPMFANPMFANPMFANPMFANPMFANPMFANPMFANPMFANPAVQATGKQKSSAKPALPRPPAANAPRLARRPRIAVLDTGIAADGLRPSALDPFATQDQAHWEQPDGDLDAQLDPAAGHGTFIAGLIDLVTPGCDISVEKVLSNYGEGDEVIVAQRVHDLAGTVDIINLSFGGYAHEQMYTMDAAVRRAISLGTVVVASAGNDAVCRPMYPAALRGVVSVGAFGPSGPAPFTNYGPWVRACAPGVDVVSWFFTYFNGPQLAPSTATATLGVDPDTFENWARWSGTSFAAPMVAAALARHMGIYDVDAKEAVKQVIDHPALLRLPDLGTVVNIS